MQAATLLDLRPGSGGEADRAEESYGEVEPVGGHARVVAEVSEAVTARWFHRSLRRHGESGADHEDRGLSIDHPQEVLHAVLEDPHVLHISILNNQ